MKSRRRLILATAGYAALSLVFARTSYPQQPETPTVGISTVQTTAGVDSRAHEATVHLVEVLGLKEKMMVGVDADLDRGIAVMKAQAPSLSPEFIEEWRKRMKARLKPEDFIAVVVQVYERHFTADELDQLDKVAISKKEGKPTVLPDALKEKLQKNAIAIQSEIIGGTSQIGARLGMEIGEEIGKEHPEWVASPAQKPTEPAK
ncbi:hypothetical protein [Occallatibacter savannae]|uniref:hypothetical protein n=1 Tax=Occallatibacter savannae TaxID=1002691 RepID=UPI000D69B3C5|nr:hypothetical protein [Occallatibacter savannae]